MSFRSTEKQARSASDQIQQLPADIDWRMLDKSRFFILGAALFSGVSGTLYPVMVLKTRQQVYSSSSSSGGAMTSSSLRLGCSILRQEGIAELYRGFPTTLLGTIPARVVYMTTLEVTKIAAGECFRRAGVSGPAESAAANAVGGLAASVAAQLVWTPVDVISQRLMIQKHVIHNHSQVAPPAAPSSTAMWRSCMAAKVGAERNTAKSAAELASAFRYKGGLDAFRCIRRAEGWRGLYRGFGLSIATYAPSNALWWGSYCMAQRTIWRNLGYHNAHTSSQCGADNHAAARDLHGSVTNQRDHENEHGDNNFDPLACHARHRELGYPAPSTALVMGVQGASAACAAGVTALLTTPLDTIKTRLQVNMSGHHGHAAPTLRSTLSDLLQEGGWKACYRGLGPRWAMMVMSAITMITTYESLKRLSKKKKDD